MQTLIRYSREMTAEEKAYFAIPENQKAWDEMAANNSAAAEAILARKKADPHWKPQCIAVALR